MQAASARPIEQLMEVTRKRLARFRLTVRDADGNPEDITGDTFTLTLTDAMGGTTKGTGTCTIVEAASGQVNVTIPAATLNDSLGGATVTTWYYILERTHAGETFPIFQGECRIGPLATTA